MAQVDFYGNQLKNLLTDPSSFSMTPGAQFALKTGLGSITGQNSRMRGNGNVLAALTNYGTGVASQDYGNQVSRLGQLLGQEEGYDINQGNLKLGQDKLSLDTELGRGNLANQATQNANQATQIANAKTANDQQFGLGMYKAGNDFSLGSESNANTAQNNWMNYLLGKEQNANTAAANQNNYSLGSYNAETGRYNADTSRGAANADSYYKWLDYLMKNRYPA